MESDVPVSVGGKEIKGWNDKLNIGHLLLLNKRWRERERERQRNREWDRERERKRERQQNMREWDSAKFRDREWESSDKFKETIILHLIH